MEKKVFRTRRDAHIYDLVSEALDEKTRLLLDELIEQTYSKGRIDIVSKINPTGKLKHGIFTRDVSKGKQYIDKLTIDKPIVEVRDFKDGYVVSCVYEDYYLYNYNHHTRGSRMHFAHVDSSCLETELDYEILNYVVKPTLSPSYRLYQAGEKYDGTKHLLYWD